jgi:hypothetical protein
MSRELGPEKKHAKSRFMKGEGFPLYIGMGHRLLDIISKEIPQPCSRLDHIEAVCQGDIDKGAVGLFLASSELREAAKRVKLDEIDLTEEDVLSLEQAELDGADIFENGIEDLDFPFHFIPWLAVDVMRGVEEEASLTEEERVSLTIADYASIIRTTWFKSLLLRSARTANGVWENVGSSVDDYQYAARTPDDAIKSSLEFNVSERSLPPSTRPLLAEQYEVDFSEGLIKELNACLRREDSVGCPVAARTREIDLHNPHTARLVEDGLLKVKQREHKVVGRQTYDPITRSADVLADYLDKYAEQFGQPIVVEDGGKRLVHIELPKQA